MELRLSFTRKPVAQATEQKKGKGRVSQQLKADAGYRVTMEMSTLKDAVESATNPDNCTREDLIRIYRNVRKDAQVKAQYKVALNKVMSEPYLIISNGTEAPEKRDLFAKSWFNAFIKLVLDTEFEGYTLVEFGLPDADLGWTYVKAIDPLYINPYKKMVAFQVNGTDGVNYDGLTDALFLLELGDPDNLGDFESVAREVIWKTFGRSDWSEYNERFGKPLIDIACNTDDDGEVADKVAMAKNFGTNSFIVRDLDDTVNMISPTGSANGSQFEPLVKYCDEAISKIMNGQTGTADNQAWAGTAQVQERVLNDFTAGRIRNLQSTVNDTLIPFLIRKGWPLQGCKVKYPILDNEYKPKENPTPEPVEPVDPNEPTDKKAPVAKKANGYPW